MDDLEQEVEIELLEDGDDPEAHEIEEESAGINGNEPESPELSSESEGDEENSEDREAIRARRRQERQDRKDRAKERQESLRRELQARDTIISQLQDRLGQLERRNTGSEAAQIGLAKKEATQAYHYFKDQIRIGTESNNGKAVADATEKMMLARGRYEQLDRIEKALNDQSQRPQPLDPRLQAHAESWMQRNNWYNPQGGDQDSEMVLFLDNALAREGWNPTTPQYWQELDSRIKKYLPHRVKSDIVNLSKPKSVVSGSGQEVKSNGSLKQTFKLSAERVKALKDAGVWEDPQARDRMIKKFRDYDKQKAKGV